MPETPQSEVDVPATQKEADTPGPTSPLPECTQPTLEKDTSSNPEPSQATAAPPVAPATTPDKGTSSNPEPSHAAAARPVASATTPDKGTSTNPEPSQAATARPVASATTPDKGTNTTTPDKGAKSDPKPKTPAPSKASAPEPQKPKVIAQPKKMSKAEPDDEDYEAPVEDFPPPAAITKATLMKRLARICAAKEDGTYKVPLEIIQSHKNLETRDEVYRAFEKCGCDPVSPPRLATVRVQVGRGTYVFDFSCGS